MTWPLVVAVNYHRIGPVDQADPFHRLHTVAADTFEAQIAALAARGPFVALEQLDDPTQLAPISFTVSFDDVPVAAHAGIDILEARGIPYTVAVCTQLAEVGHGIRDKVYFITHALGDDDIYDALHPELSDLLPPRAEFSFYYWSKSAALPHREMEARVIDPLLQRIGDPLTGGGHRAYMSWDQLRLVAARPGATIVNHGHSHANYAALTAAEIAADVTTAHQRIHDELGVTSAWFAVPFGVVDQRLSLDIVDAIHPYGYKGVLWAGKTSLVAAPQPSPTMRHILRLHTPTDIDGLAAALDRALEPPNQRTFLVESLPPAVHRRPVDVVDGDKLAPVRALEHLVRQDKPYAVDDDYFGHQFHDNPARRGRPAYHAVVDDGRPEAILYNFHATFTLDGHQVPGVYLAGWRRLPAAHHIASGLLLRRVTEREPVVGVANPNPDIDAAFADWQRVDHTTHRLEPTGVEQLGGVFEVETSDRFPADMASLVEEWATAFDFSLHRTAELYRWRYDRYPLATSVHLTLRRAGRPVAYGAVVQCGPVWSVSDFLDEPGSATAPLLVQAACNLATRAANPPQVVTVQSSDPAITASLGELGPPETVLGRTYYLLNPDRLDDHDVHTGSRSWAARRLHDTEVCGDVLPRPTLAAAL